MPNTTNFNWTTPADTDLVKDGALAIRTLANGIDTSLVDLKGGTTGQVLSKATNTDLDFTWVAQDDSNAIQNAIIDAKGDLIVGTAADTPARLAVGATNGHVLTVDSAETSGMKWAAVSGGAGNLAQIATGSTTSGSSFTVSGLSSYSEIIIFLYSVRIISANRQLTLRLNSNSGSEYDMTAHRIDLNAPNIQNFVTVNDTAFYLTHTNMSSNQAQTSWAIKLTNCKTTGFTDMDFTANYEGTISFEGKGVYTVNEAISSFTIAAGSPATWDNGTYIVWGA